jgi:hypothetical protein
MCPGSVALSADTPSKSSKYALEGTAAHQLAEECILNKRSPYTYINGGTVTIEDDDGNQTEYEVSANMAEAVMTYLKHVTSQALALGIDLGPDQVEVGFHLDWIDEDLWGTNDLSFAIPFDTLHTWDYKHGQGIPVDVQYPQPVQYYCGGVSDKNPQLMYYALGAIGPSNEHCVVDVEIGIAQPRADHRDGPLRTCKVSVEELFKWRDEILVPGIKATRVPNAPLCAGDHCKFCPAIGLCPEVGNSVAKSCGVDAKQAFGDEPIRFPNPKDVTPEARAKLYEFATLFESWLKQVKEDTHEQLKSGHDIPGLKLVKGRSSRKWNRSDAEVLGVLERFADYEQLMTEPQLKSVAQVEKVLKKVGAVSEMVDMVETSAGTSVALESDKRPALRLEDAAEAFA